MGYVQTRNDFPAIPQENHFEVTNTSQKENKHFSRRLPAKQSWIYLHEIQS
jgi:hypothetical protein